MNGQHDYKIIILGMLVLMALAASAEEPQRMTLQVKQGQVRAAPSFLGKIVTTLSYGTQVDILEAQGDWRSINLPEGDIQGWMHISALSKKEIILNAGDADVAGAASSDEVALAGKGFNAEVEARFRAGNTDADYVTVDKMEQFVVSQVHILRFLKDGGLTPEGGPQ